MFSSVNLRMLFSGRVGQVRPRPHGIPFHVHEVVGGTRHCRGLQRYCPAMFLTTLMAGFATPILWGRRARLGHRLAVLDAARRTECDSGPACLLSPK